MSSREYSVGKHLVVAAALVLGASGTALADDSSMSRFGGESYAYFNNQPVVHGNTATVTAWRQRHPNGLTERELQALSSSSLASWQAPDRSRAMANVAESPSKETISAQITKFLNSGGGTPAGTH